jgi:hypothetical protein
MLRQNAERPDVVAEKLHRRRRIRMRETEYDRIRVGRFDQRDAIEPAAKRRDVVRIDDGAGGPSNVGTCQRSAVLPTDAAP